MPVEPDVVFKAAAALVTTTFGAFVLAGRPRRTANLFLAFFLFLIAGNQYAEAIRALGGWGASPDTWARIAAAFAFLDPFALFYFLSVFPERNRLNQPRWLALAGLGPLVLAAAVPFLNLTPEVGSASLVAFSAWALVTALVYSAGLVQALETLADQGSPGMRALVPALCMAVVPAWQRVLRVPLGYPSDSVLGLDGSNQTLITLVLPTLAAVAIAAYGLREGCRNRPCRRTVLLGALAGLGMVFATNLSTVVAVLSLTGLVSYGPPPSWLPPSSAGTALKWLAISALLSSALLKHRMLELSLAMRRRAARGLVGGCAALAVLGGTLLVADATAATELAPAASVTVLFLVVWVSTEGFRRLVDVVAQAVYGVPRPGDRAQAIQAYRAGVQQALEEQRALASDAGLARLRDELGLDPGTADTIERMAQSPGNGPVSPGSLLEGRYRIREFLGGGSSGRLVLARDELLDRDVALKEVLHERPEDGDRVLEEARAASRVNHRNVVTVHDVLARPGSSVIVSEHVPGGSLRDRLEASGPLPLDETLRLVDGILSGLEAIHGEGIAHGDLKPANVLVTDQGTPRIVDFGTARVPGDRSTVRGLEGVTEGTPPYMAPERRRGGQPTVAGDLYAVGVILEECLGERVPESVAGVVERSQRDDPGRRFASASQMRRALPDP